MSAPVRSSTVPRRASGLRPVPLLVAVVALLASMLAGLLVGAVHLPARAVLTELVDLLPGVHVDSGLTRLERNLLVEIRLPRVLAAALVGGLLAIAGAGSITRTPSPAIF